MNDSLNPEDETNSRIPSDSRPNHETQQIDMPTTPPAADEASWHRTSPPLPPGGFPLTPAPTPATAAPDLTTGSTTPASDVPLPSADSAGAPSKPPPASWPPAASPASVRKTAPTGDLTSDERSGEADRYRRGSGHPPGTSPTSRPTVSDDDAADETLSELQVSPPTATAPMNLVEQSRPSTDLSTDEQSPERESHESTSSLAPDLSSSLGRQGGESTLNDPVRGGSSSIDEQADESTNLQPAPSFGADQRGQRKSPPGHGGPGRSAFHGDPAFDKHGAGPGEGGDGTADADQVAGTGAGRTGPTTPPIADASDVAAALRAIRAQLSAPADPTPLEEAGLSTYQFDDEPLDSPVVADSGGPPPSESVGGRADTPETGGTGRPDGQAGEAAEQTARIPAGPPVGAPQTADRLGDSAHDEDSEDGDGVRDGHGVRDEDSAQDAEDEDGARSERGVQDDGDGVPDGDSEDGDGVRDGDDAFGEAGGSADVAGQESGDGGAAAGVPVQAELDELADPGRLRSAVEAVLLVVDTPTSAQMLAQVLGRSVSEVEGALHSLRDEYDAGGRGLDLREVADGWRLYSRDEFAGYVERFIVDGQQARLTQAALETLAVIAYRQPVTRSRISAIRGVSVDAVMRTLLTRGLVEECGADPDTGGGLYRTTSLFLEKMGLRSLDELPSLAPLLPDTSQLDDVELST